MTSVLVRKVGDELARYQELKAQIEQDLDPVTLLDTLEGETDLHEALCVVADSVLEYESLAAAVDSRLRELQSRKTRFEAAADTLRGVILMACERAGLDTVRSPVHTISVRKTKPQLVVEDEAALPADYFVPSDPRLDRKALKAALEAGNQVPGARLSNGGISLAIKVK